MNQVCSKARAWRGKRSGKFLSMIRTSGARTWTIGSPCSRGFKMELRMMFVEGVLASKNASAQNYIEVN